MDDRTPEQRLHDRFTGLYQELGNLQAAWGGSEVGRARLACATSDLIHHMAMMLVMVEEYEDASDLARMLAHEAFLSALTMSSTLGEADVQAAGKSLLLKRGLVRTFLLLDALTPYVSRPDLALRTLADGASLDDLFATLARADTATCPGCTVQAD